MGNIVAVLDKDFIIPKLLSKTNGNRYKASFETLLTPYGLLLPTSSFSFNLIEYIEGRQGNTWRHEVTLLGCILTAKGVLYEFTCAKGHQVEEEGGIKMKRLPYGVGTHLTRSDTMLFEEQMQMAMHLTGDLKQSLELISKVTGTIGFNTHYVMNVDNILAKLVENGCTVEIPTFKF